MPGAAIKLLALIDDPDMSVSQIEDILRHDAGLTANLLKLANSAYFGIPSKVGSVRQAVLILGLKRLIQMVIASCFGAIMDKPIPGYDLPPGELWRHAIAVSVAAEGLVHELEIGASEEIFTAALLHDVGKAIDRADHVRAGIEALDGFITERTGGLILRHMDAHALREGKLGARARRRLQSHDDFDELMLLCECDVAGRVPGAEAPELDDALDYLRDLSRMCEW